MESAVTINVDAAHSLPRFLKSEVEKLQIKRLLIGNLTGILTSNKNEVEFLIWWQPCQC